MLDKLNNWAKALSSRHMSLPAIITLLPAADERLAICSPMP